MVAKISLLIFANPLVLFHYCTPAAVALAATATYCKLIKRVMQTQQVRPPP
jgi:hypothetical protein